MPNDRLDFKTRVIATILIHGFNAVCDAIFFVAGRTNVNVGGTPMEYGICAPRLQDVEKEVADNVK